MSAHASHAPAGWYPHRGVLRYWDGVTWTEHTQPLSPAVPPPAVVVQRTGAGSVAGGILLAALVVFVGIPAVLLVGLLLLASI